MIPRFKPSIGTAELAATISAVPDAVGKFEAALAARFDATHGIAFGYGRSALFALLQALGLKDAEVILPAYTCSVVAHAVALSGNRCRFVDITLRDYNMDLDQVDAAINERTRMIVATHLFGYPLDVDRLEAVVSAAERRFGHRIVIVQDCAHAFGARWRGRQVAGYRDVTLFGLNISKLLTSIFGGALTTIDAELASQVRQWRAAHQRIPSPLKTLSRAAYLSAAALGFTKPVYGLVRWLQDETPVLNPLTRAYHLDDVVALPPDFRDAMIPIEARVGLVQLSRYQEFERARQANARAYFDGLEPPDDWILPPAVDGATYSHFPVRVASRQATIAAFRRAGIQLGEVIEYSVPHLAGYRDASHSENYPNSLLCSRHMINLPVHPALRPADRQRVMAVAAAQRHAGRVSAGARSRTATR